MKYLYTFNYHFTEKALCDMEFRALFGQDYDSHFTSHKSIDPSSSPFLRHRLALEYCSDTFEGLILEVEKASLIMNDFKVIALNDVSHEEKRYREKALGLRMHGFSNFKKPSIIFGVIEHEHVWYFGQLLTNDSQWRKHKKKPYSYSSSLNIHLAKALVNIAGQGDYSKHLIDPCCGVGTVLLEAHHSGYDIEGIDILPKVAEKAMKNIDHYDYDIKVSIGDIADINENYDACIIDLPYGISTHTKDEVINKVISEAGRIAKRVVYVSTELIDDKIPDNMEIKDTCVLSKGKAYRFKRYICLCEQTL